jgi:hypothetical protein
LAQFLPGLDEKKGLESPFLPGLDEKEELESPFLLGLDEKEESESPTDSVSDCATATNALIVNAEELQAEIVRVNAVFLSEALSDACTTRGCLSRRLWRVYAQFKSHLRRR